MAVTVTIELTEEQWEIIRDNLPLHMKDTDKEVITPERLAEIILKDIKHFVLADMRTRELDLTPFRTVFNV